MKRNRIFDHVNITCIAIMTIALLSAGIVDAYMVRRWIAGVALAIVGCLYTAQGALRKCDFTERAMARLTKAGMKYKKKEDGIVVKQGDVILTPNPIFITI